MEFMNKEFVSGEFQDLDYVCCSTYVRPAARPITMSIM